MQFVHDKPWMAYNWYLGNHRSRIEINNDLPMRLNQLVEIVAHEAYPGHHTHGCVLENRLVSRAGHIEHSVVLLYSPASVVSEAVATSALHVAMSHEEQAAWFGDELFPRGGLQHLDARQERLVSLAMEGLEGTAGNGAYLLHEHKASDDEVFRYFKRYALDTDAEARKMIEFLSNPLERSYVFTYQAGRSLLKELFDAHADVSHWFTRVISEPVTPTQIREWTRSNHPSKT